MYKKFTKLLIMLVFSILFVISLHFQAKASEEGFYLKGSTGLNIINAFNIRDDEYKGKIKVAHAFPLVEVGVGYKFANNIKIEGVFDYYFLFHSKENAKDRFDNHFNIASKTKAHAFFLNAYKDICNLGNFTPFLGGGVGVSTLQETATGYAISNGEHFPLDKVKSKKVNRAAYKLTLGTEYKMSDNFTAELSYNYFNLGYNKPQKINGIDNVQHRRYGVHGVILGIRKSV
jgi:opacity protein-like surface antigen